MVTAGEELVPRNELEKQLFSLLKREKLEDKDKENYKIFFLAKANDEFIEELPYDRITQFIYSEKIYETSVIDQVIAELIEYVRLDEKGVESQKKYAEKCLQKILRHIHLALVQYDFIEKNIEEKQSSINSIMQELYKAQTELESFNSKVTEVEKSIYTNQMSVLGIFAGIVTAFIGGFGVTINVFSNLVNKVPLAKIVSISSILFIGIVCVIYLLLTISSRIINHERLNENAKRVFYLVIRILALMCLGSALIYQLQFSNSTPIFEQQGIWYWQVAKWVEIFITVGFLFLVIFPKPIFIAKNKINNIL
ncbi:hypothetical protein [Lactococcus garvieae]|uniref:hypothetical protein n=1 Tax=Lactococcus garvieae TaxID=1363 RepID=UPI0038551850